MPKSMISSTLLQLKATQTEFPTTSLAKSILMYVMTYLIHLQRLSEIRLCARLNVARMRSRMRRDSKMSSDKS